MPIYVWMDECICARCSARHLVRVIETEPIKLAMALPLIDGIDEREGRRILREGELEMRTIIMEIERNMAALERLMRDAEAQAAQLREPSRQSTESMAFAGTLGVVAFLLSVVGGGALSCLALPVALYAVYVQWDARQQIAEDKRQRQTALYQLKKRKLAEADQIEEHIKQLKAKLAAGPTCVR
jgi:hypothetical protein